MIRLPDNTPFGDYTVQRFIKEGLYNDSYLVKNADGEPFFMKFFDLTRMPSKMITAGQVTEIVFCSNLDHPNIIQHVGHGSGKINGKDFQYLLARFFNGKLLSEVLREGRTFTAPEAKAIIIPILKGITYLHDEKGLNHNDLTPRNILLESQEDGSVTPKIIDLGHTAPDVTDTVPFPLEDLNVLYVAPEALTGTFTGKSDVFAVSAILYTLLYGRAPWHCPISLRDSFYSKKISVGHAREAALSFPRGTLADPEMEAILQAGLDLDPSRRPDASVLLDVLSENFTPDSVPLRKPSILRSSRSAAEETRRACRRNR